MCQSEATATFSPGGPSHPGTLTSYRRSATQRGSINTDQTASSSRTSNSSSTSRTRRPSQRRSTTTREEDTDTDKTTG